MFEGEEDFVLPPQPNPPTAMPDAEPFVLEGWEEAAHQAPQKPHATPSAYWLRKRALRQRIEAAEASRKKAPTRMGRWIQKLKALPSQVKDAVTGGVRWLVKSFVGGKRKRVEEEACDTANINPAKRPRLDDAVEASADAEKGLREDQVAEEDIDNAFVEPPDFGFEEFGYGAAEDQAATDAILGAEDDFDEEFALPEAQVELHADEEAMEVDVGGPVEVMEVDVVDVAGNGNVDRAPEAQVAQPVRRPLPKAKPAPRKSATPKRRRRALLPPPPPTVVKSARGRGFTVKMMSDNTVRISGTIPGVDWKGSSLFKAAHNGEVVIQAPPRDRFKQVAAGRSHVMILTHGGVVMTLGNNKFGQLGTSLSRSELTRAAAQTLGTLCRPLYGMAGQKVTRISARGNESRLWVGKTEYCCGVANDGSWSSPVMRTPAEIAQLRREGQ